MTGRTDKEKYYDDLGDDFDSFMTDYDVERRIHLLFDDLLAGYSLDGNDVLEVGSGTGRITSALIQRGCAPTIVDIGIRLVRRVSREQGCMGVAGSACSLPFADESFDLVVSSECIEHTAQPLVSLAEMYRVCRRGGLLCITTPNKLWFPVLVASQLLNLRRFSGLENWIWPRQAIATLQTMGADTLLVSGCHLWPFQLTFTRPLLRRADRAARTLYPLMINFGVLARKA